MKTILKRDVSTFSGTFKKGTPVLILTTFRDGTGHLFNHVQVGSTTPIEIHGLAATAIGFEEPCNPNQDNS